jgi:hypothetical protein
MEQVIEREDPFEEATPAEETKVAEPTQPEVPVETKEEKQPETSQEDEAVVEIDGQKLTAKELKEWQEAYRNKSEWQKSNTQKAQEIAVQRKEMEEAIAINTLLKSKPELKQRLFTPEPERNLQSELDAHYGKRPEVYGDEYIQWEKTRDRLVSETAALEGYKRARTEAQQQITQQHNDSVVNTAYEKYKGKLSEDEFRSSADWVLKNIRADQGMYPQNAFDVAYAVLHGPRDMTDAKINATKSVIRSIEKAKPASGEQGSLKPTEKISPEDEEDEAFAQEVKARMKK